MATHTPVAGPAEVVLTDGVVVLRPPTDADVDQITAACADPALQRFLPVPRPYRRADAEAYVAASAGAWAAGRKAVFPIVDPAEPEHLWGVISISIAGSCGNCGYWTAPDATGRGVARRALLLVCEWGFEARGLAIVLAEINPGNEASVRVARAAGFHRSHEIPVDPSSPTGETERILYLRLVSDPPPPEPA